MIYRGDMVRQLVVGLVVYTAFGLWVLYAWSWPANLIGGPVTDAVFAYCVWKAIRIWDARLIHLEDSPIPQCTQRKGHWRCDGMNGHVGPHIFGASEKELAQGDSTR